MPAYLRWATGLGVAMTLGASNDPIVVTLLGIAFVIPYASKGYAFASLPPPNAA